MKFLDAFSPRWNISLLHYHAQVPFTRNLIVTLFVFWYYLVVFLLCQYLFKQFVFVFYLKGRNWRECANRTPSSTEWGWWIPGSSWESWLCVCCGDSQWSFPTTDALKWFVCIMKFWSWRKCFLSMFWTNTRLCFSFIQIIVVIVFRGRVLSCPAFAIFQAYVAYCVSIVTWYCFCLIGSTLLFILTGMLSFIVFFSLFFILGLMH